MTGDHGVPDMDVPDMILPDRQFRWEEVYMSVSIELVEHTIEVLQGFVAQWRAAEGLSLADDTAHRLMAATCSALGGLIAAHAAHNRQGGARELVDQIHGFLGRPHAVENLEAVRQGDVDADIIDALIALAPRVRAKLPESEEDRQRA